MKKFFASFFLFYLRVSAKIQIFKVQPKVIGITGSVGKTSLRDSCFAVLKDFYRVKKSYKANSETGLPLDILGIHLNNYSLLDWIRVALLVPWKLLFNWRKYDFYIAEMGIDEPQPPKNMEYLLRFLKPDIAVFLNVKAVHTMQFKSVREIAKEKGKILKYLDEDKIAVANWDDDLVRSEAQKSKAEKYWLGTESHSGQQAGIYKNSNFLQILEYKVGLDKTEFKFQYKENSFKIKFLFPVPEYYGYTIGASILVGLITGLSIKQIKKGLQDNFCLPPGRGRKFKGIKESIIIDSSYNASCDSTIGALELLDRLSTDKKRIFVFGDMREMGEKAEKEHQRVAGKVVKVVDRLVLVGPLTKKLVLPIVKDKILTKWFRNSWQAGSWLKRNLKGRELVLVKGSQNTIFTEIVVEKILADKNDINKLCRRGKFWDKMRKNEKFDKIK